MNVRNGLLMLQQLHILFRAGAPVKVNFCNRPYCFLCLACFLCCPPPQVSDEFRRLVDSSQQSSYDCFNPVFASICQFQEASYRWGARAPFSSLFFLFFICTRRSYFLFVNLVRWLFCASDLCASCLRRGCLLALFCLFLSVGIIIVAVVAVDSQGVLSRPSMGCYELLSVFFRFN